MLPPRTSIEALAERRKRLSERVNAPVLLAAGQPVSRNYRANRYPFRAASHFLYFVGRPIPGAALLLHGGRATLFAEPPDPEDALWHGPRSPLDALARELGVDDAQPLAGIDRALAPIRGEIATLPTSDAHSAAWLSERLGRAVGACSGDRLSGADADLADAVIALRLRHDEAAVAQLRYAAEVSACAHVAGMRATRANGSEAAVCAVMLAELRAAGCEDAYGPIVTTHGEVLHCDAHAAVTEAGELLLCDVGGETPEGWAADITRTWPVGGRYTATQRAVYDVVLDAQLACVDAARPGRRYRELHEIAKRRIVEGLRALHIFRGEVDGLLERGAAALFFPHGVGHLLGLDVHDMEDLGDRAGYAAGRSRSPRFGDGYLRLDRDLEPGMAVTIEPGFYQVPAILEDERFTGAVGDDLDRAVLGKYADVRGIRIEDDVLVTADGPEVLTRAVPKRAEEIEAIVGR